VVDVLGTGQVTITTRVNKRLQTLVLSDAYISFLIQGETYFQITAYNGRCKAMDTYHDIMIRYMKQKNLIILIYKFQPNMDQMMTLLGNKNLDSLN